MKKILVEKELRRKQDLIDLQEENNIRILNVNKKYGSILRGIQNMSDYASNKYIKEYIKKELTPNGQSKS